MSKRHLEPDATSVNREVPDISDRCLDPRTINREEKPMNDCPSFRWRSSGANCTSPLGSGNLKRPRAFALQRFDFSLLKGESAGCGSMVPSAHTSIGADTTQCLALSTSAAPIRLEQDIISSTVSMAPTMILPFLFLGSQNDALSKEFIMVNNITHVLNASASCPKSPFVPNDNFLRIPVNDSHTERLLPYFEDVTKFLDDCCKSNGRALVHCLAGISRSPTFVIAYVMRHLRLSQDDAYRYVKIRRSSISPNFNFLGQLLEFEAILQRTPSASNLMIMQNNTVTMQQASPWKPASATSLYDPLSARSRMIAFAQSPTTALAKLSFEKLSPSSEEEVKDRECMDDVAKLSVCADNRPKSTGNKALDASKQLCDGAKCLSDYKLKSEASHETLTHSLISQQLAVQDKLLLKPQTTSPVKLSNPLITGIASGKIHQLRNTGSPPNSRRVSPPIRPSSIAISSLQFDFSVLNSDLPLEFKSVLLPDSAPYSVLSCMAESHPKIPLACSRNLLKQVESACRSQSFSDIPALTSTRTLTCGVVGDAVPEDGSASASRTWHSTLEAHASNGSLSSVSSRGSLHGSREMVQVS